ncbi:hypothetical protein BDZ89DRAFT_1147771 [Hymenopellis radicata]|nr:hypothetical protein BDZ89DRAFT_1147771 [Hymenopellis radicata]
MVQDRAQGETAGEAVWIADVFNIDGDFELSRRKSKLITIFDCEFTINWEGNASDGSEVAAKADHPPQLSSAAVNSDSANPEIGVFFTFAVLLLPETGAGLAEHHSRCLSPQQHELLAQLSDIGYLALIAGKYSENGIEASPDAVAGTPTRERATLPLLIYPTRRTSTAAPTASFQDHDRGHACWQRIRKMIDIDILGMVGSHLASKDGVESLKTLLALARGILDSPHDATKRRIKLNNDAVKKRIFKPKGVLQLAIEMGFCKQAKRKLAKLDSHSEEEAPPSPTTRRSHKCRRMSPEWECEGSGNLPSDISTGSSL